MKYLYMKSGFLYLLITFTLIIAWPNASHAQSKKGSLDIYAKSNLVAWCIVPFDDKNRTPEERALMLNNLGITKLAYDWREKHVPTFDAELEALQKHGITLQAFWYSSGLEPEKDKNLKAILDALKRHQVKTQIWCMIGGAKEIETMTQEDKIRTIAKPVTYIAKKAAEIGCTLGLYNHGGWFGEPENQLAIIDYVKLPNIGIVYNFSHSELQIQRFADFFPKILPHLYAINITGLKDSFPATVVPVGQGNMEFNLLRIIKKSAYAGPIGIINEDFAPDAAAGLQLNMDGMKRILKQSGDESALKSYR